ncbi:2-dehydropantoate 2-reductase [Pigmentiphaga soli]|uniref:2-dehydropantoate 2-reductase n=1 Tax=Pigmentiphaga soli TaxID=1007095 RepID=A0ABP8HSJ0_9BURK
MNSPRPASRRIGIVGAGAIGGHVAARLALAGHDVSVLARGATLDAIRRGGLHYRSGGDEWRIPLRAVGSAQEMGAQELVVIAVKGQSLPALAPGLGPLLGPGTAVLPVINGLPWWYLQVPGQPLSGMRLARADPDGAIERALPLPHVLGGTIFASCHTPAPGSVVHSSGARLALGEPGGGVSERARLWADVLAHAGLGAVAADDIRREIWLKLLGNVCVNPLSLLTCATTDRLVGDPPVRELMTRMMTECIGLGRALGLAIDIDPAERIAQTSRLGAIKTSMLQDLEAGRGVELDGIVGAPLECAALLGHPMPMTGAVFALACQRARQAGLYA